MNNNMAVPAAVQVTDVGKRYRKVQVLKNISFQVMSGECVAIVGRNGDYIGCRSSR